VTPQHIRRVERATKNLETARGEWELAIRAAREAGATLREVADAAHISHEHIRRLTERKR
jgi:exonuclease VII small subunit